MKALAPRDRPMSLATDIYETEFEYDDSDTEETQNTSPRFSLHSVGLRFWQVKSFTKDLAGWSEE